MDAWKSRFRLAHDLDEDFPMDGLASSSAANSPAIVNAKQPHSTQTEHCMMNPSDVGHVFNVPVNRTANGGRAR